MRIAIFGTGYVGLVTGACFSNVGHQVTCVDIDEQKIKNLKEGVCPIVEKDLPARLETGIKSGNLKFTTNSKQAIEENDIIFIAVGTPTINKGQSADLSAVFEVAREIDKFANSQKIIVQKSTVPVGTGELIENFMDEISNRKQNLNHLVVSNPEFLKEGNAVADFESPDRVIIGTDNEKAKKVLAEIYRPFMRKVKRMIFMSRPSAELTKVFANTMLAMRISSMNAITELAEIYGADLSEIREGVGSDSRIGPDFLFAGGATFGGSCFPKDVRALVAIMNERHLEAGLFEEILKINSEQRRRFIFKIFSYFDKSFKGKKFAIWGLSFKPGTDDVREAASLDVVSTILDEGGEVAVYDSNAMESFQGEIGGRREGIVYEVDQYQALKNADALVILTDAMEFRSLNVSRIKDLMKIPVIFDGKNLYDPMEMVQAGIDYHCMGRPYYYPK